MHSEYLINDDPLATVIDFMPTFPSTLQDIKIHPVTLLPIPLALPPTYASRVISNTAVSKTSKLAYPMNNNAVRKHNKHHTYVSSNYSIGRHISSKKK